MPIVYLYLYSDCLVSLVSVLHYYVLCLVIHQSLLRGYSWFCVQESLLAVFRAPDIVPGIDHMLDRHVNPGAVSLTHFSKLLTVTSDFLHLILQFKFI